MCMKYSPGEEEVGRLGCEQQWLLYENVLQMLDLHLENERLGRKLINIYKITNNLDIRKKGMLKNLENLG